jgi:hypothetical protein
MVRLLYRCAFKSAEPLYGYLPSEHKEVEIFHPAAIVKLWW